MYLFMTTTATNFRCGQGYLILYFTASVFFNSLQLTRTSRLRVLDWIIYATIKMILGLTSTKDWLIVCMSMRVEQKLLESGL